MGGAGFGIDANVGMVGPAERERSGALGLAGLGGLDGAAGPRPVSLRKKDWKEESDRFVPGRAGFAPEPGAGLLLDVEGAVDLSKTSAARQAQLNREILLVVCRH